jgi:hypothetical protein
VLQAAVADSEAAIEVDEAEDEEEEEEDLAVVIVVDEEEAVEDSVVDEASFSSFFLFKSYLISFHRW